MQTDKIMLLLQEKQVNSHTTAEWPPGVLEAVRDLPDLLQLLELGLQVCPALCSGLTQSVRLQPSAQLGRPGKALLPAAAGVLPW